MSKLKILITGSNGLLGQKLVYGLRNNEQVELIATARGENRVFEKTGYAYESMDLTDADTVKSILEKHRPDCIIHTAAMTNVDACELDPAACELQNVTAVKNLLVGCKSFAPHFIDISTDFVFNGEAGPYSEEDEVDPLSIYARSKVEAEKLVMHSGLKWAILRTMIIYGVTDDVQRSNVIIWTKNSIEQGKEITVITDQFRGPTLAEDLADACIQAALRKAEGIYHVSGREVMPIIDISLAVAEYFGLDKSFIKPITTAALNQPAKRPLKTGFIITKAERELGYKPHSLKEGIAIIEEQMRTRGRL
ncbi:MAG TPA: SDR family oxidoreductase [Bacteroidia bacterium]|jgi:dTDP-4-dehydrorhamnose reductase|nr:SDR family oxidoreductase [Bacteroidia bacterium]HQF28005.1 SDR family oxidoreductase [Bacteroidia bacterium]